MQPEVRGSVLFTLDPGPGLLFPLQKKTEDSGFWAAHLLSTIAIAYSSRSSRLYLYIHGHRHELPSLHPLPPFVPFSSVFGFRGPALVHYQGPGSERGVHGRVCGENIESSMHQNMTGRVCFVFICLRRDPRRISVNLPPDAFRRLRYLPPPLPALFFSMYALSFFPRQLPPSSSSPSISYSSLQYTLYYAF
eukprot:scaffold34286_cov37-Tisochrysis_lutea.AAC.1